MTSRYLLLHLWRRAFPRAREQSVSESFIWARTHCQLERKQRLTLSMGGSCSYSPANLIQTGIERSEIWRYTQIRGYLVFKKERKEIQATENYLKAAIVFPFHVNHCVPVNMFWKSILWMKFLEIFFIWNMHIKNFKT